MITVNEALSKIEDKVSTLTPICAPLNQAYGLILAENTISKINQPPFNSSAMDGYAVAKEGLNRENTLFKLVGLSKAGDDISNVHLSKGECIRVFTGSAVPNGCHKVVIQEKVKINSTTIEIPEGINEGANIRLKGEQYKKGDTLLFKGQKLNAAAIGLLASSGISKVNVIPSPKVSLIITGNELTELGKPLKSGEIYESNSYMLEAALKETPSQIIDKIKLKDNLLHTKKSIAKALEKSDIVILSGGISVGDFDFVGEALKQLKVETVFYKVKQKPGKPIFYGRYKNKEIFALPGNPASALTGFYIYVLPAIRKKMGFTDIYLQKKPFKLTHDLLENKSDRTTFLKAKYIKNNIEILGAQSSAMLKTYAVSNALAILPPNSKNMKKGASIEAYILPKEYNLI
ncbi:MAG: molybdopterin molybdotransferase MoeA [Chitinophagales bacterium]|nr:molybdopterin molybdotransferase MoeA [Chitinophagales bacterium]